MTIHKINVQNFTAFDEIELQFQNGIHVLLGENGSGKTHLLKMMYACCTMYNKMLQYPGRAQEVMELVFASEAEDLIRSSAAPPPSVEISYADGGCLRYELGKEPKRGGSADNVPCVFIPVQEMLSHAEGFVALYEKYNLPFDQTYFDILLQAQLPQMRKPSKLFETVGTKLSKLIGGTVLYENDTFYMKKENGPKIKFILEAEGLRKFGLLWKLLHTGAIDKGSVLFWDEPEANVNPELMPALAEILLELQRGGVQIFLATHHYNLIRYLDLCHSENDAVHFYSFYIDAAKLRCETSSCYQKLQHNPIDRADQALYEKVIRNALEEMQNE